MIQNKIDKHMKLNFIFILLHFSKLGLFGMFESNLTTFFPSEDIVPEPHNLIQRATASMQLYP